MKGWTYTGEAVTSLQAFALAWLLGCVQSVYGDDFLDPWRNYPNRPFPCYYAGFLHRYLVDAYRSSVSVIH